jgi:hypothetical protein
MPDWGLFTWEHISVGRSYIYFLKDEYEKIYIKYVFIKHFSQGVFYLAEILTFIDIKTEERCWILILVLHVKCACSFS